MTAVSGPFLHELAPFLQRVHAPVRAFDLVPGLVRQRLFSKTTRKVSVVAAPIAEAGSEAVRHGWPHDRFHHHRAHYERIGVGLLQPVVMLVVLDLLARLVSPD